MKVDNLLELLKSFSGKEKRKFIDFIKSPYFNKRRQIADFAIYLLAFHPELNDHCLSLGEIPDNILTNQKKTKKELSYLKSELYSLAKEFIGIQAVKKESFALNYYTAIGLTERGNKRAVVHLNKLMQELGHYERPRLQEMHMHFLVVEMLKTQLASDPEMGEFLLQASIDSLERLYLFSKIGQSYQVLNRETTLKFKDSFRNSLIEEIEIYLGTTSQIDPQVAVLFQLYKSSKPDGQAEHFDKLLSLLKCYHDKLNLSDLRGIYLATINLSIRFMRVDLHKYAPITLGLYEEGIKSRALFEKDILSPWTYTNAIKVGLKLRKFEWVNNFIEENKIFLPIEERFNAFYINSAELAYAQSNYNLSLDHLQEVNTRNIRYYLNAQILYIKSFYETGNIDSCLHTLAALKSYLSRKKEFANAPKKNYQLFSNLLFRILMIGVSDKKRTKLAEDLANMRGLLEKDWLLSVFERESKGK